MDGNETAVAPVVDFAARRRQKSLEEMSSGEVRQRLRRLVGGDHEAAAWLYDTFSEGLFRRLRRRYGYISGVDPSDLLHDAFVFYFQRGGKVLRDFLERVEPEEQTAARLERHLWDLACGVASNRRRSAALRDHPSIDDDFQEPEDPTTSNEEELVLRDQLACLDRCLRERGERLYLYFKLRYDDGYTPSEIVELTGWSKKTTYKLRQKLNDAVRECAEALGIEVQGTLE